MKTVLAAGLTALLLIGAASPASAHAPSDPEAVGDMARLSAEANLIFRGKVTDVEYRNSAGGPNGARGLPYTFVTYAISSVLEGPAPGRSITLRFVGGADGRGGFVEAEGVPLFQAGDEDILFVAGNGATGCPPVMCEFGRFRVLDGVVYEAHGAPIVSVEWGRMRAEGEAPGAFQTFSFPAPGFDELLTRPDFSEAIRRSGMTTAQARARYEAEAPEMVEMRIVEAETAPRSDARAPAPQAIAVESFVTALRSAVAESARRQRQAVRSIDPDRPIAAPATAAAAPPAAAPAPAEAERLSPGRIIRKD